MFEIIVFAFVFFFFFKFQKDIEKLQHEIFLLKRAQELSAKEHTPQKESVQVHPEVLTPVIEVFEQTPEKELSSPQTPPPQEEPVRRKTNVQQEPNLIDKLFVRIKEYFTTGNIIVRIGGVVLFFGLAFLAKYAAQHSVISMEVRLFAIAFVAVVLVGIGWRLRTREGYYGLILQGVGVAIFYLVIYTSAKMYLLMSLPLAFFLMLGVVVTGVVLSLKQNALPLALFSISGGFIAPILTSDGSGSHIALFSYYALLNLGIFIIAWYRSWRVLNVTGFFFTFVIATAWGILEYESQFLLSSELFLGLFYLMYLVVSILFTYKQEFSLHAPIDATLVFGLPLIAFALQVSLVESIAYALAWSAFALGTLYFILYYMLRSQEKMQLLSLSFFALGVLFYTIVLPYLFDTRLTATLWALEGASVIYISLRQNQRLTRYFGSALLLFATFVYLFTPDLSTTQSDWAYCNTLYLGYLFIIAANLFSAYSLDAHAMKLEDFEKKTSLLFFGIAMIVWFIAGLHDAIMIDVALGNVMLIYIALWGLLLSKLALFVEWRRLEVSLEGYFLLGALFLFGLSDHYLLMHPFEGIGSVALVSFFAVHYFLLYLFDAKWQYSAYTHLLSLWFITTLLAWESYYQVSLLTPFVAWSYFVAVALIGIVSSALLFKQKLLPRFFENYEALYKSVGQNGLILMLFVALLYSFKLSGANEFTYLPLVNPLDLMACGLFFLFYKWMAQEKKNKSLFMAIFAATLLGFISVVLARSIHAFVGVEYELFALLHSMEFQMGISIVWSLVALGTIVSAKRLQNRTIWSVGASLIGVVVVKLFLVELSKSESIERIISFIVVGVLLLLIGYFAPLPPKSEQKV
jgi:uncharacterized membrane protein